MDGMNYDMAFGGEIGVFRIWKGFRCLGFCTCMGTDLEISLTSPLFFFSSLLILPSVMVPYPDIGAFSHRERGRERCEHCRDSSPFFLFLFNHLSIAVRETRAIDTALDDKNAEQQRSFFFPSI